MKKLLSTFFLFSSLSLSQLVSIGPAVFAGAGLNDAAAGGRFTSAAVNSSYAVTISGVGTPDQFQWSKNGGAPSAAISITGAAQPLGDGVTVKFTATTGHTLADLWTITTTPSGTASGSSFIQRGVGARFRTVEDKLRESPSVIDFGADPTGATSSDTAFKNAGDRIFVPNGKYTFLLPFRMPHSGSSLTCQSTAAELDYIGTTDISKFVTIGYVARGTISASGTTITSLSGDQFDQSFIDQMNYLIKLQGQAQMEITGAGGIGFGYNVIHVTNATTLTVNRPVLAVNVVQYSTWAVGVATYYSTGYTFQPGATVTISGMSPAGYNVTGVATAVDANTFTIPVAVNPGSAATVGGSVTGPLISGAGFVFAARTLYDHKAEGCTIRGNAHAAVALTLTSDHATVRDMIVNDSATCYSIDSVVAGTSTNIECSGVHRKILQPTTGLHVLESNTHIVDQPIMEAMLGDGIFIDNSYAITTRNGTSESNFTNLHVRASLSPTFENMDNEDSRGGGDLLVDGAAVSTSVNVNGGFYTSSFNINNCWVCGVRDATVNGLLYIGSGSKSMKIAHNRLSYDPASADSGVGTDIGCDNINLSTGVPWNCKSSGPMSYTAASGSVTLDPGVNPNTIVRDGTRVVKLQVVTASNYTLAGSETDHDFNLVQNNTPRFSLRASRSGAPCAVWNGHAQEICMVAQLGNPYLTVTDGTIITKMQTIATVSGNAGTETNHDFNLLQNNTAKFTLVGSLGGTPCTSAIAGINQICMQSGVNPNLYSTDGAIITKLQTITASAYGSVGTQSNHNFSIITNNTPRMLFDTAGNITLPGSGGRQIYLITNANPNLYVTDGTVNAKLQILTGTTLGLAGTESNHPFSIITNNTERIQVSAAGNVNINGGTFSIAGVPVTPGITALTGDVTASGTGSVAATLSASGVAAASYGDATHSAQITFDAKGRATAASSVVIDGGATGTTPISVACAYFPTTDTACKTVSGGACTVSITVVTGATISCAITPSSFTFSHGFKQ
jgi:hypothetical protein